MRHPLALAALAALATGCATAPAGPSADRAAARPAASPAATPEYDAAAVRALAVTEAELGPGWHVTLMQPGQNDISSPPLTSDIPACQPVLDALTPSKGSAGPLAEADLDIAREDDGRASLYTGILAFRPGRAAAVHAGIEHVLDHCRAFTSTAGHHLLTRLDTPTPEGADAATAFTLTDETDGATIAQRALVTRAGDVLAVFTTLDATGRGAPEPDAGVVRAQLAKLGRKDSWPRATAAGARRTAGPCRGSSVLHGHQVFEAAEGDAAQFLGGDEALLVGVVGQAGADGGEDGVQHLLGVDAVEADHEDVAEPGLVRGVGGAQRGVRGLAAGGAHAEQGLGHPALVGQGLREVRRAQVVTGLAGGGEQGLDVGVGAVGGEAQGPTVAAAAGEQCFFDRAGVGFVEPVEPQQGRLRPHVQTLRRDVAGQRVLLVRAGRRNAPETGGEPGAAGGRGCDNAAARG